MRIAIVSPEFPPHTVGGGGAVVEHVAHFLARHNLVDVNFGSWNRSDTTRHGNPALTPIPMIHVPGIPPSLVTSMPPTPRGLLRLLRHLRHNPDIVHLHGVGHPIVDMAATICRAAGTSYILVCHGLPLASNPHPGPTRTLYRVYEQLIGLQTLKNAKFVIAISERVAKSLERKGIEPSKIRLCYHIPTSQDTTWDDSNFRELAHITPEKKVILLLGSVSYRKGADLAVEIASSLRRIRNDFVLYILGHDGGMMHGVLDRIRALNVADYVKVLGFVSSRTRDSAFEACDLVLFPSRDEPYGLVPLEAIAHEKPVLVSIHSGVSEILKGSDSVFDPYQAESAARKINEILEKPDVGRRLVGEASNSIRKISRENTEDLYEELSLKSRVTAS